MIERAKRKMDSNHELGSQRYHRYVAAFDHVLACTQRGYHLEAIAVLDSLLGDRLASRLSYLWDEEVPVTLTLGQLCHQLLDPHPKGASPMEGDSTFQTVIKDIRAWVKERNHAIHAVAKIIRDDEDNQDFYELLECHRISAERGIDLLQRLDRLDTAARQKNGKVPATWPNAFFPEKQ